MLGTKELLAKQQILPPEIVINPLERGPSLSWNLETIAQALDFDLEPAKRIFADGRILNGLVAIWLGSHGFRMEKDGESGYFLISENNGATYRLRVAREKLALEPSIASGAGRYGTKQQMHKERGKIDGWAVLFTCDLPTAPIWFVADSMADLLQSKSLLNESWRGDSGPIRDFFIKAEPAMGLCSIDIASENQL